MPSKLVAVLILCYLTFVIYISVVDNLIWILLQLSYKSWMIIDQ